MAIASTIEALLPVIFAAGALGVLTASFWPVRFPKLALLILFISIIAGQLLRLPLPGQGGGLLLSDLAAVLVLAAALFAFFYARPPSRRALSRQTVLTVLALTPFLIWSLLGLVVNFATLLTSELLIALSYWARLTVYLMLLPALIWLLGSNPALRGFAREGLLWTVAAVSVLGFVQLWLVPDLGIFADRGWDPHQNRLVSTWMDPNLLAGFLVAVLPFAVWRAARAKLYPVAFLLIAAPSLALLFTQSRSGLVAFLAVVMVITPVWLVRWLKTNPGPKAVFIGSAAVIVLLVGSLAVALLGDRAAGLLRGDATVQLRAEAMAGVWTLAERHSLFGTGYNAYQFAALEAGLIGDFGIHSRAGADNSWLTLWVTTGLAGVVLWLLPWLYFLHRFLNDWFREGRYLSLAAVSAFAGLFAHSQFVNSFLYGHMLIVLIIIFALAATAYPPGARAKKNTVFLGLLPSAEFEKEESIQPKRIKNTLKEKPEPLTKKTVKPRRIAGKSPASPEFEAGSTPALL